VTHSHEDAAAAIELRTAREATMSDGAWPAREHWPALARERLGDALPVRETGIALVRTDRGPVRLPVLRLDAATRPDVRDLARVLRLEGEHVLAAGWQSIADGGRVWFVLDIGVTRPVSCRWRLVLPYGRHRAFLDTLAGHGVLAVTTGTLTSTGGVLDGPAIVVPFDRVYLHVMLTGFGGSVFLPRNSVPRG
jgi:hypothetical protein